MLERAVDTGLQRSARSRRLPARFRDSLPASAPSACISQQHRAENRRLLGEKEVETQEPPPDPALQPEDLEDPTNPTHTTTTNSFGLFREFPTIPSHIPQNPDAFADIPTTTISPQPQPIGSNLAAVASTPGPEPHSLPDSLNLSEHLLLAWLATGAGNTPEGVNDLVHNIILHPDFNGSDLEDFNAVTAIRRFEREHFSKPGMTLKAGDGWKEGSVSIRVPCTKVKQKEDDAPEFTVDGILYRDIVEVIMTELKDPDSFDNIHVTPYTEWWNPGPGEDPVRVYSEIYNSDAMLEADKKMRDGLHAAPRPEDDLETFIVSALLYSDSTHLASFGSASLWPVYLYLGNVSKYTRLKPSSLSAHHIAYIPTVR